MPKDQTAIMCHNIAKYNREHQQPDLTPLEKLTPERATLSAELLNEIQLNTPVDDDVTALQDGIDALQKIAAGEYKPVVHAHWNGWTTSAYIGSEDDFGDPKYADRKFFRCSKCRYGSVVQSKYCPSCGALMGKDDGHEQD